MRGVLRARLQILRNSLRLVPGPTPAARVVLLWQLDDLARCADIDDLYQGKPDEVEAYLREVDRLELE